MLFPLPSPHHQHPGRRPAISRLGRRRTRGSVLAGLAVGLTLALVASPADATPQDREEEEEGTGTQLEQPVIEDSLVVAESLPEVPTTNTIATKLPLDLAWTPAHVGLVGDGLFEEQGARFLGDALENVSGVNVQTGNSVFDFFTVRGFDSLNGGLILTDGAPELESTFFELYNVERVEVFKGPAGFLYGSNPLAGAVNLVREQPAATSFFAAEVQAGSYDTYQGTLDWNRASESGQTAFRLNGLVREEGSFRDGVEGEVTAVNPAFTWRPDEATRLNLNLEVVSADRQPDAGLPLLETAAGPRLADVPRSRSYASPLDRSEQDLLRGQVDFERDLSPNLTLRSKSWYRELDWLSDGTLLVGVGTITVPGLPPELQPDALQVFRTLVLLDDRQESLGTQLELVWRGEALGVRHNIVTGVEVSRLEDVYGLQVAVLPPIGLEDPVDFTEGRDTLPILQTAAGDTRARVLAPYVLDQIELSDRFQLLLGARYDDIDFEDEVSGTERSDGEVSPILGAVWSPSPATQLYANLARSFAPPSPRVVGDLAPEESEQIEVGVRRRLLGDRLGLTLAAFQIDRTNIAIPDDNGFTQQAGDQRSRGVELELTGRLGRGAGALDAAFSYAYTDSELTRFAELIQLPFPPFFQVFDRSGNRAAFAPEHLANLWLGKTFESGLTLSGGARHVGDQYIAEDNRAEIDAYTLLDAAASYRFDRFRLSLNLFNLTDEDYETRAFGTSSVIPGAPFTATVGLGFGL